MYFETIPQLDSRFKAYGGVCGKRVRIAPAVPDLPWSEEYVLRLWGMPQSIVLAEIWPRENSFRFKEARVVKNGILCYQPQIVMAVPSDYYSRLHAAYEYGRHGYILSWTDANQNRKFAGRPGAGLMCQWERDNKEVKTEQNEIVLSFSAILDKPVLEIG